MINPEIASVQRLQCEESGYEFVPIGPDSTLGFAIETQGKVPINGLRHPPAGDTNGWYVWCGVEFSDEPDFFEPLHTRHLFERCPEAIRFLGLPPGCRFLFRRCLSIYECRLRQSPQDAGLPQRCAWLPECRVAGQRHEQGRSTRFASNRLLEVTDILNGQPEIGKHFFKRNRPVLFSPLVGFGHGPAFLFTLRFIVDRCIRDGPGSRIKCHHPKQIEDRYELVGSEPVEQLVGLLFV